MADTREKWEVLIELLTGIQTELQLLNALIKSTKKIERDSQDFIFLPFKGAEIYLLQKAFVDSGDARMKIIKYFWRKLSLSLPIEIREDSVHRAFASTVIRLIRKQRIM